MYKKRCDLSIKNVNSIYRNKLHPLRLTLDYQSGMTNMCLSDTLGSIPTIFFFRTQVGPYKLSHVP